MVGKTAPLYDPAALHAVQLTTGTSTERSWVGNAGVDSVFPHPDTVFTAPAAGSESRAARTADATIVTSCANVHTATSALKVSPFQLGWIALLVTGQFYPPARRRIYE